MGKIKRFLVKDLVESSVCLRDQGVPGGPRGPGGPGGLRGMGYEGGFGWSVPGLDYYSIPRSLLLKFTWFRKFRKFGRFGRSGRSPGGQGGY